jgi:hypothetical protein
MLGEHPAHASHLFPAAGNNVEDAGGEAGQLREGGQGKGREGRVLRWLEDTGAASRQRRCHLHVERSCWTYCDTGSKKKSHPQGDVKNLTFLAGMPMGKFQGATRAALLCTVSRLFPAAGDV